MMFDRRKRSGWSGQRYGVCAKCGKEMLKRNMTALMVKESSYVNPALLCHVCQDCLPELLDLLDVSMPVRE